MPSVKPEKSNGAAADARLVYLAETTSDLADERELVRDELRQRGYARVAGAEAPARRSEAN